MTDEEAQEACGCSVVSMTLAEALNTLGFFAAPKVMRRFVEGEREYADACKRAIKTANETESRILPILGQTEPCLDTFLDALIEFRDILKRKDYSEEGRQKVSDAARKAIATMDIKGPSEGWEEWEGKEIERGI